MKNILLNSYKIAMSISFLFLVQASALAAQQSADEWRVSPRKAKIENPIVAEDSSITVGKNLYLRECQQCHGESGKGDGPVSAALEKAAANLTSSGVLQQTDGAIYTKIRVGRTPMPSFKSHLSKEEIWHLINFIRHDIGSSIEVSSLQ